MVGLLAGLEHTQHQGREEHCPVTCLGRGHHQFSFDPVNLTHHPQGAGAEIQVIPLECQALPRRRPVARFQQQKLVAAVFPGLNQQVLAFLGISRTVRPFNWAVSTQAKPASTMRWEITILRLSCCCGASPCGA